MVPKQRNILLILGALWIGLMLVPERLLVPPTIDRMALPMAWLAWGWWGRYCRKVPLAVTLGGYLLSLSLLSGLARLLNVDLAAYLITSLDTCSSYNDAMMSAPTPALSTAAQVVYVSAWIAMGIAALHIIWPRRIESHKGETEGLAKLYQGDTRSLPRVLTVRFFSDIPSAFVPEAPCVWQQVVEKPEGASPSFGVTR